MRSLLMSSTFEALMRAKQSSMARFLIVTSGSWKRKGINNKTNNLSAKMSLSTKSKKASLTDQRGGTAVRGAR